MDDDAQRPARADRDRRLNVQVLLDDALAGLVGALGRRLPNGLHQIALGAAKGGLRADAEQCRERDALQEVPGVEVDLVLEAGIACRVGRREIVDHGRSAVGHDDALPDQQRPALPERDDAVVGAR